MARFRLRNVHLRKRERKKRENDEHIRKKPVSNSENCQSADSLVYDRIIFVALPLIVIVHCIYRTRAIITRGLYTFYPLFEVHLCTVTFGLMYG